MFELLIAVLIIGLINIVLQVINNRNDREFSEIVRKKLHFSPAEAVRIAEMEAKTENRRYDIVKIKLDEAKVALDVEVAETRKIEAQTRLKEVELKIIERKNANP